MSTEHTRVVAITGPPAAGKSTVSEMIEDFGIPVISTGEAMRRRAEERYGNPSEDEIWQHVTYLREEHGPEAPTLVACEQIDFDMHDIVCVSDLREQAELDYLREEVSGVDAVLCIRVDAPVEEREDRYVNREMDGDIETIPFDQTKELRTEILEREARESPYPAHDLELMNYDSVSMDQIWHRLDNVFSFIRV